jgi:hypothetical protein
MRDFIRVLHEIRIPCIIHNFEADGQSVFSLLSFVVVGVGEVPVVILITIVLCFKAFSALFKYVKLIFYDHIGTRFEVLLYFFL